MKLKQRLSSFTNRFNLIVLDNDNLEEKRSLNISILDILIIVILSIFIISIFVISIIFFTPVRVYFPNYSNKEIRMLMLKEIYKIDSLETLISKNKVYLKRLDFILKGQVDSLNKSFNEPNINKDYTSKNGASDFKFSYSEDEVKLREEIEEDKYNILVKKDYSNKDNILLFSPTKGTIKKRFNASKNNYSISISCKKNSVVKSVLDGTIIISQWTVNGYVVAIKHPNNMISIYKNNAFLLKSKYNNVKAGEAIAICGYDSKKSNNLEFELLLDGFPVNPENYIDF